MKAFLLAGGRGERLYPLTMSCPKCLVPIAGIPLLQFWLELCRLHGIGEVLLNVSHHADQVNQYLRGWSGSPLVRLVVESEPHGTAGTVSRHREFVEGEESFWILYADNLTDVSLTRMLDTHRRHNGPLTMGLFHAPDPRASGIVAMDDADRIVSFIEKPTKPTGDLANAGIYLARLALLAELPMPDAKLLDFGIDVFPRLIGRMHGHIIDEFVMDIGTPAALAHAAAAWAEKENRRQVIS